MGAGVLLEDIRILPISDSVSQSGPELEQGMGGGNNMVAFLEGSSALAPAPTGR